MTETIDRAAMRIGLLMFSVERPGRHHTIIFRLNELGVLGNEIRSAEQGFITSRGRFVDRKEAYKIALDNGVQLIGNVHGQLFSEDLW